MKSDNLQAQQSSSASGNMQTLTIGAGMQCGDDTSATFVAQSDAHYELFFVFPMHNPRDIDTKTVGNGRSNNTGSGKHSIAGGRGL